FNPCANSHASGRPSPSLSNGTVSRSARELLVGDGSSCTPATAARLVNAPLLVTTAVRVRLALLPAGSAPKDAVTRLPALLTLPWLFVAMSNTMPAGSWFDTPTPVAGPGPALVTFNVKVTLSPTTAGLGATPPLICKSA